MKHKVLLLGLGFWANFWLKVIQQTENVELAGITGTEAEIEKVCKEYGFSKDIAYSDYKEAIEKADAEIMIIVIPAALHADAAKRGMDKGLHIIMEKPLAASLDEARELLEYKSKYPNLKVMTSQNYRWRTYNQTIKKAILDGMIGNLESILVEFRKQEDLQGYRAGLDMPLLRDCSIHHFDLIRFFTGADCKEMTCRVYRPSWSKFNGKPNTDALMTLTDGTKVVYNGTWAARGRESSWDGNFVITGEKGCLTLDAANNVRFFEFKEGAVSFEAKLEEGVLLEQVELEATEMQYGLIQFIKAIENDTVPETTMEDNIKSFEMVCAGMASIETNQTIIL